MQKNESALGSSAERPVAISPLSSQPGSISEFKVPSATLPDPADHTILDAVQNFPQYIHVENLHENLKSRMRCTNVIFTTLYLSSYSITGGVSLLMRLKLWILCGLSLCDKSIVLNIEPPGYSPNLTRKQLAPRRCNHRMLLALIP